jgi:cytochrome c biogenesis protein CcdA
MVMGPQILSSIFLVTSREPVKNSLAMLAGAALGVCTSIFVWYGLVNVLDIKGREGSGPSTADYAVAGLLVLLAIHVFRGRGTAKVPKWMTALQEAKPRRALALGYVLILLMPTDIIAVISTVQFLHDHHDNALHAWPVVAACTLFMALPILAFALLGHRARAAMPGIREWLTTHAWLVNLVVIVYFIFQLVK